MQIPSRTDLELQNETMSLRSEYSILLGILDTVVLHIISLCVVTVSDQLLSPEVAGRRLVTSKSTEFLFSKIGKNENGTEKALAGMPSRNGENTQTENVLRKMQNKDDNIRTFKKINIYLLAQI